MILAEQHYRMSFATLALWCLAVSLPVFSGAWYGFRGRLGPADAMLAAGNWILLADFLAAGLLVVMVRVDLLPRGLVGYSRGLRRFYMPYSGILEAACVGPPGLRFWRLRDEAGRDLFVPLFLGRAREFHLLLDALLPASHVVRPYLETAGTGEVAPPRWE